MTEIPDTLLVIYEIGIPLYSARGIIQTFGTIGAAAQIVRDADGHPMDLSYAPFRKYASKISCSDQAPPAFDGTWPGRIVTVDCAFELGYLTIGGTPSRTVVDGSMRTEGNFTYFRPQLTMMIMALNGQFDEWEAGNPWSIDLEEY